MPLYMFRFTDSTVAGPHDEERRLPSDKAARQEATRELTFLMSSRLPDGDARTFSVAVRDETGDTLYEARLVFSGHRLKPC